MIFTKYTFITVNDEKMYKQHMNGLNDSTTKDFSMMALTPFYKDEYVKKESLNEYIRSYISAAEILAKTEHEQKHPKVKGICLAISDISLAIPIIYMCHHVVELTIKKAIYNFDTKPKSEHNLIKVWDSFYSHLPSDMSSKDKSTLKNLKKLVEAINKLDTSSTQTRYPLDNNEERSLKQPYWINTIELVKMTKGFIEQMDSIDYSKIREVKKHETT